MGAMAARSTWKESALGVLGSVILGQSLRHFLGLFLRYPAEYRGVMTWIAAEVDRRSRGVPTATRLTINDSKGLKWPD